VVLKDEPARFQAGGHGMQSERFSHRPSTRPLRVIAVTGTSGKTTTTWLAAAALAEAGLQVGVLSDLGCLAPGDQQPIGSAYGSRLGLAVWLGRLAEAGCSHAVVEVSDAMLAHDLLADVELDTLVVTNHVTGRLAPRGSRRLTAGAPATAVAALRPGGVLVTGCDPMTHARLEQRLPAGCATVTAGLTADCDVRATPVEGHLFGRTVLVSSGGQLAPLALATPVVSFVRDSLLAAAIGGRYGIPLEVAVRGIESTGGVPGRVERLDMGQDAALFLDSPTSGHALAATLGSLRRLTHGRLVVIAEEPLVERIGGGRFGPLVARYCDGCVVAPVTVLADDPADADVAAYARIDRLLESLGPDDCGLVLGGVGRRGTRPPAPAGRFALAMLVNAWLRISHAPVPSGRRAA
jgi:UDP-N-acetylmuramoyl-L-alanyl-D-glutamate--2,6-diaminopimelate ligase